MRELKFRIWDKQNKTWLKNSCSLHCFSNWSICPFTGKLIDYVGIIDGDHGDKYTASHAPDYYMQGRKIVKEPRYVIQQYIGMKDCNGKEIYEGDILEELRVNETQKALGVCKQVLGGWRIFSLDSSSYWHGWKQTIIGNIFETPELLK